MLIEIISDNELEQVAGANYYYYRILGFVHLFKYICVHFQLCINILILHCVY